MSYIVLPTILFDSFFPITVPYDFNEMPLVSGLVRKRSAAIFTLLLIISNLIKVNKKVIHERVAAEKNRFEFFLVIIM